MENHLCVTTLLFVVLKFLNVVIVIDCCGLRVMFLGGML